MQGSKQFKQALLKNLLLGLRKRGVASGDMGFHERKSAIKHAADAALASARGAAPRWSRTLQAAELAQPHRSAPPGPHNSERRSSTSSRRTCRRSFWARPRKAGAAKAACGSAGVLARAVARKRIRVLKGIVPGGKGLDDECTLLGETLDYAVSLKAQVDVMQLLVRALQAPKP